MTAEQEADSWRKNTGPTVTLAEAARRSHLSIATLRRWLVAEYKLPGAVRNELGAWRIPVASLVNLARGRQQLPPLLTMMTPSRPPTTRLPLPRRWQRSPPS